MSKMVTMMVFVSFLLTFGALITYMPSELYSSDYESPNVYIPSEFESWKQIPADFGIEHQITKVSSTIYDFSEHTNTTRKIKVQWKWLLNDIKIYGTQEYLGFIQDQWLLQFTNKQHLIDSWDEDYNASFVKVRAYDTKLDVFFEDYNATRNDIGASYDDGILNCTITVPQYLKTEETLGAREIIISLLTFRTPEVFYTINPLLGFILSVILYIPICFIFFNVIMTLIHGD